MTKCILRIGHDKDGLKVIRVVVGEEVEENQGLLVKIYPHKERSFGAGIVENGFQIWLQSLLTRKNAILGFGQKQ